jgi:hypothetical protein
MKVPLIVVVHHGRVYDFENVIEQLHLEEWREKDRE